MSGMQINGRKFHIVITGKILGGSIFKFRVKRFQKCDRTMKYCKALSQEDNKNSLQSFGCVDFILCKFEPKKSKLKN